MCSPRPSNRHKYLARCPAHIERHNIVLEPLHPYPTNNLTHATMHWFISITAIVASMANIVVAAPPSGTMRNPLRPRQEPLCSSNPSQCFGPAESLDCRGCNEDCFAVDEDGQLCKARCWVRTTTGAGTPVSWCGCDSTCLAREA